MWSFTEIRRYIPEVRVENASVRELYAKYFYDVVLYKERPPQVYTEFNEHLKQVLVLGFFAKMIEHYLKE